MPSNSQQQSVTNIQWRMIGATAVNYTSADKEIPSALELSLDWCPDAREVVCTFILHEKGVVEWRTEADGVQIESQTRSDADFKPDVRSAIFDSPTHVVIYRYTR